MRFALNQQDRSRRAGGNEQRASPATLARAQSISEIGREVRYAVRDDLQQRDAWIMRVPIGPRWAAVSRYASADSHVESNYYVDLKIQHGSMIQLRGS